jgi:hypothetical protein
MDTKDHHSSVITLEAIGSKKDIHKSCHHHSSQVHRDLGSSITQVARFRKTSSFSPSPPPILCHGIILKIIIWELVHWPFIRVGILDISFLYDRPALLLQQ